MIVGGYTVDLYCDTGGSGYGEQCPHMTGRTVSCQGSFAGQSERDCLAQARRLGWTFRENVTKCYCPKCSRTPKQPEPTRGQSDEH